MSKEPKDVLIRRRIALSLLAGWIFGHFISAVFRNHDFGRAITLSINDILLVAVILYCARVTPGVKK